MFHLNGKYYFKSEQMCSLDNRFGDLYSDIQDLQNSVECELKEKVLSVSQMIYNVLNCCAGKFTFFFNSLFNLINL